MIKKLTENNHAFIHIDPMDDYDANSPDEIMQWCGLLPAWVVDYQWNPEGKTFLEHMAACYGFGKLYEMTGGKVTQGGQYQYPEDPDLNPLLHIKLKLVGAEFLQWNYGICAFKENAESPWFVTRMD